MCANRVVWFNDSLDSKLPWLPSPSESLMACVVLRKLSGYVLSLDECLMYLFTLPNSFKVSLFVFF